MLIFQNKGLIPLEAITTVGINVKVNENPIGHFGTGLKLAIATIIRNGGSVSIWRGMDENEFGVMTKNIRGKDFNLITMNGQPINMTDEFGKNWQPWMAMRELESNVRDELGKSFLVHDADGVPLPGYTTVIVDCHAVQQAWMERDKYFLQTPPVCNIDGIIQLHARVDSAAYFYRGIKVGELPNDTFPFTVNLTADFTSELSEDRTLDSYIPLSALSRNIPRIEDIHLLREIFPAGWREGEELLSRSLDYDRNGVNPSDAFIEHITHLAKTDFFSNS